jgi:hypothetical protein
MNKIELIPHRHAALIRRWAEALCTGQDMYWVLEVAVDRFIGWQQSTCPSWRHENYRIRPSEHHPHYKLWQEWEALVESGAAARGEAWVLFGGDVVKSFDPDWDVSIPDYRIVRATPKNKLIDWAKMPRGTMTSHGELIWVNGDRAWCFQEGNCSNFSVYVLRLRPATTEWQAWTGGDCPVPDGTLVDITLRDGIVVPHTIAVDLRWWHPMDDALLYGDIIAYRVVGLADGYTDNPDEAV